MTDTKKRSMRFDRDFQCSVLKLMLTDPKFCASACEKLQASNFSDRLSWFFTSVKDWHDAHGAAPTRESIAVDILKHPQDKHSYFIDDLKKIFAIQAVPEKIKAVMTEFIKCNIFVELAVRSADLYNQGKHDDAFQFAAKSVEQLDKANFQEDPCSRFGDALETLAKAKSETENGIRTGIRAIDDEITGLLPGTFTVWLGASNSGKSMLGPTLSKQAAMQGKRTFVTIHEDEEIPTKLRYLACFSGISISKLNAGQNLLSEEEQRRLFKADQMLKEYVVLQFMYTKDATIEAVQKAARKQMREWKFDLFICDYGQCLTTADKTARNEVRHLHEHVYHSLKQLCLELKVAGAGGAQVNRTGMTSSRSGSALLRCTDVSEAYGIIKKATNVITINRSNGDVEANRVVFLLDKARNGKCPVAVECISNFAEGIVYYADRQQCAINIDSDTKAKGKVDSK